MLLPFAALIFGLGLLVWSADRFIDGAAATANHFGMPTLLVGMLVVGFGTSAPEMVVSAMSALEGSPGIALGNAYGSNITNIALILGITALVAPVQVDSGILKKELPVLIGVTALSAILIYNLEISRMDAVILLAVFTIVFGWTIINALKAKKDDRLAQEMEAEVASHKLPFGKALFWLIAGLILLVIASQLLVWGAVALAKAFGVSDLLIGLTIVAIGTSLPELASSIAAARKGEHDIAFGNVIGSNMFNTLMVVGIAGALHPMEVPAEVLTRDMVVMGLLTIALVVLGYDRHNHKQGRICRRRGGLLLATYVAYTGLLVAEAVAA
ncbi:calcium/sodium antiporter [Gimibacter soli]|uniref:Calcium/sodium antiporter n=1 Tax=Gimibacter soli TaxID=3024400 RepID=A0AAE9XPZ3_9PROT|nr:calcium/sodium antiporter [Gimibacter soli]WCL54112.1 calcium/sodium antiporter [Gimibacter soli]